MRGFLFQLIALSAMLLGLPLIGTLLAGLPVNLYLEFPPRTRFVHHAPFSWIAFATCAVLILVAVAPMVVMILRVPGRSRADGSIRCPFPWWGWLASGTGLMSWILAWIRFSWFAAFQSYTFIPLWLSYIVFINAVTYRRQCSCMMTDRPLFFLVLFPSSATFWWFFEYLNRFVQNWYYLGVQFGPWSYFLHATLSFSTVLPAVLGTSQWIQGSQRVQEAFKNFLPIRVRHGRTASWAVLAAAGAGLAAIGVLPNYLFPLLWIAPLLILVCLQALRGKKHIFWEIANGDWRLVISSALAALLCGGLWEMWNYYSLAKWEYSIPFVHCCQVFEMPILGYAGYLPFGLECAAVGRMLDFQFRTAIET